MTPSTGSAPSDLQLADDRLYYEVSGEGFPVMLVSGGSGMDRMQWKDIAPVLAGEFRVILFDPRGIGGSDNPSARYSDAADIAALLDHLGLERVALAGLSSGGNIVLEFGVLYPERVAGIAAAAPFIPGFEFSASMQARVDGFSEAAREGREPFLDAMFADPYFIPAPLNPAVRHMARVNMGQNFDKRAGFDPALPIPLSPPLIEQLANIQAPVLLLAGELDHPDVLRRNRFLMDQIPRAREIIIGQAGHNTALENPRAFLAAVMPFLRSLDP